MGRTKGKARKKKSEFDDFFNKEEARDKGEGGWVSGVSAMAMDGDDTPVATAPAADMDIGDTPAAKANKAGALGVQKAIVKAVRGQRTKAQKHRKAKLAEKATARADKTVVKLGVKTVHKQKKSGLKNIY